mmetsp:Transcript_4784/g.5182  ORF Transcript_4784/g.5182 Transcript_4784/m.5182 type:complete len:214 (-) Transcript_4784:23-664(-)
MDLICDPNYNGFESVVVDNSAIYNPIITVRTKDACPRSEVPSLAPNPPSQYPFPPDCSDIIFANRKYDLSKLQSLGVQQTRGSSTAYYYEYKWFVCGDQGQTCGTATDTCAVCSAFEGHWHDPSFVICEGKYTRPSVTISEHLTSSGVTFTFTGGDLGEISELTLACDPRYSGLENAIVDNSDIAKPSVFVRTREACPQTLEDKEHHKVIISK